MGLQSFKLQLLGTTGRSAVAPAPTLSIQRLDFLHTTGCGGPDFEARVEALDVPSPLYPPHDVGFLSVHVIERDRTFAFRRGAPNRQSYVLCFAGFCLCVVFYALSKFLGYVFFTEKVCTVCGNSARRLNTPVSTLCLGTLCSYITAVRRIARYRPGGGVIGLQLTRSVSLLSYELQPFPVAASTLPSAECRIKTRRDTNPGLRLTFQRIHCRAHNLDCKSLGTKLVAFADATQQINIAILTSLKGQELGWVCLGSFGADCFVGNSVTVVSSGRIPHIGPFYLPHSMATRSTGIALSIARARYPTLTSARRPGLLGAIIMESLPSTKKAT
ncbi:hypothetical protein B0H10DRAFT_2231000 [Mycena sp. CBHHK59/15]|nr:hypothetical protein B0H10DRAFT_2231000 [Mycena sp. CBHHK59/15]